MNGCFANVASASKLQAAQATDNAKTPFLYTRFCSAAIKFKINTITANAPVRIGKIFAYPSKIVSKYEKKLSIRLVGLGAKVRYALLGILISKTAKPAVTLEAAVKPAFFISAI